MRIIIVIIFNLLFTSCLRESEGLVKFDKDCPIIHADQEYLHHDKKFSIKIPKSWIELSSENKDSNLVNVLFGNDSISEYTQDKEIIRLHMVGIISYQSKKENFIDEANYALNSFRDSFPEITINSSGFSNFLKYKSHYVDYNQKTETGLMSSIAFLVPAPYDSSEYFIINSTFIGKYDPDFEICQHKNILKSFKFRKK